jgi:hypothetical protein
VLFVSTLFQNFNQLDRYIAKDLGIIMHEKTFSRVRGKLKEDASKKACDVI